MIANISLSRIFRILFALFILVSVGLGASQCQKWVPPENDPQNSKFDESESHYSGENCMNCHYTEGRGEGWFSIAGTVTGNYLNAQVHVYNDFNEPSIGTIEIDQLGNLFTTDTYDFSKGLFISVQPEGGTEEQMTDKITNGQCNLCHGVTAPVINL